METMYLLLLSTLISPLILYLIFAVTLRPRPVNIPVRDRHVFISGGSSGIGIALAYQAVLQGARVSILARNIAKLEEARDSIRRSTGVDVGIYSADVRDIVAVKRAVDEAGEIDVLICNHGVFYAEELDLQDSETVKFMVDVNLVGTLNLIKAALPAMKNRKNRGPGSIALVSSQAGQVYNKKRPKMTRIIVAQSSVMKAEKVAKITLKGIQSGTFLIHCNFQGLLLSLGSAGSAPQRSPLMAVVGIAAAVAISIITRVFQYRLYGSLERWGAQKKKLAKT
ncbi:hypothetical protein GIB67_029085 [Kingdonia uniflora]|uniref:3-dehydrosphinganine reductase n=1 Tax=Kingdonia uniflora TaxID=39325 RepID=A0A7J7N6P9_9MAGN|nr:hypothetical protein GIB67_029085 [Kingdonia uniflora]